MAASDWLKVGAAFLVAALNPECEHNTITREGDVWLCVSCQAPFVPEDD